MRLSVVNIQLHGLERTWLKEHYQTLQDTTSREISRHNYAMLEATWINSS